MNYTVQYYPDSDFMPTYLLEEINRYFWDEDNEQSLDDLVEEQEEKEELLEPNN